MRPLTVGSGIVVLGILTALPFRRVEPPLDLAKPPSIATGPKAGQIETRDFHGSVTWPDRIPVDTSLSWQPQPMQWNTAPRSVELPPMPEQYVSDALELPVPQAVRERFTAGVFPTAAASQAVDPVSAVDPGIAVAPVVPGTPVMPAVPALPVVPQDLPLTDRFVYTPMPVNEQPYHAAKVSVHSTVSAVQVNDQPSSDRQYIREPQ